MVTFATIPPADLGKYKEYKRVNVDLGTLLSEQKEVHQQQIIALNKDILEQNNNQAALRIKPHTLFWHNNIIKNTQAKDLTRR